MNSTHRQVLDDLARAVVSFDSDVLQRAMDEAINLKVPLESIIKEGVGKGMETVGEKYERGEYFLSDLIMSAVVMNEAMERLTPMLRSSLTSTGPTVIIGTVEGDLHDIGKNLVKHMLESVGYEILDLGTDVSPQKFVQKTAENKPAMVCMSTLLSVTMPKVGETIQALSHANLRKRVKILVGGRCLTNEIAEEMGADGYGKDCFEGLKKARELLRDL